MLIELEQQHLCYLQMITESAYNSMMSKKTILEAMQSKLQNHLTSNPNKIISRSMSVNLKKEVLTDQNSEVSTRLEIVRDIRKSSEQFRKFSDQQLLFITSPEVLAEQEKLGLSGGARVKHLLGLPQMKEFFGTFSYQTLHRIYNRFGLQTPGQIYQSQKKSQSPPVFKKVVSKEEVNRLKVLAEIRKSKQLFKNFSNEQLMLITSPETIKQQEA